MQTPVQTVTVKTPVALSTQRLRGNKNVFWHCVDVAKDCLPAATFATLHEKATAAKASDPGMGFMKHFKRIAETELSHAGYDRIDCEASRRDGSGA